MPESFFLTVSGLQVIYYFKSAKGYFYRETNDGTKRISSKDYVSAYEQSLELPF